MFHVFNYSNGIFDYIYLFISLRLKFQIPFTFLLVFFVFSCRVEEKKPEPVNQRVFPGYHVLLDEIIRSKDGIFRGLDLNNSSEDIRRAENSEPVESSAEQLYYELMADSSTSYSIAYILNNDSLEEINVEIITSDPDLGNYLFCDLKDYYSHKLPNPKEDKGYVVYNCFEGQRKPFVVSLSDNSSPTRGIINMVIYKDQ
jgi:hypothetical protein